MNELNNKDEQEMKNYGLHETVLVNIEGNWEKGRIHKRYKNYCSVYSVKLVKNTNPNQNKFSAKMVHKWSWMNCPYDNIKKAGE